MKKLSSRSLLRSLVHKHPDWTHAQYAEYLGQSVATVRGALSAMKLSKRKVAKEQEQNRLKPKTKIKASAMAAKPDPAGYFIASKASPTRFGYTKLI